ncbi:MAG: hypothetical protein ACREDK_07175 [Thermoplasmata archaeon]
MSWTLFCVPTTQKAELDAALRDDQVARQSQKVRDAPSVGGPSGHLYVLIEGGDDAVKRAETLLAPVGTKLPSAEADGLYRKFKDEDEAASAGMGLFFTEG